MTIVPAIILYWEILLDFAVVHPDFVVAIGGQIPM